MKIDFIGLTIKSFNKYQRYYLSIYLKHIFFNKIAFN